MESKTYTLNTGVKIPAIGLGTWQSQPGQLEEALKYAVDTIGYRLIDTAWGYGNEIVIGITLKKLRTPQEELFITTKLFGTYHTRVERGLNDSLRKLQLDYVDFPLPPTVENYPLTPTGDRHILPEKEWSYINTWKAMEKCFKKGKCKAIGVSNMSIPYLERLLRECEIRPAVNQVEVHPLLPQQELVEYCQQRGIMVEGYSPLGSTDSPLLRDVEILEIARNHRATAGQVLLSWQVARAIIPLPKSVSLIRLEENFTLIQLTAEEMKMLNTYAPRHGGEKRLIDPPWGVNIGFDDGFCERKLSQVTFRTFPHVEELP